MCPFPKEVFEYPEYSEPIRFVFHFHLDPNGTFNRNEPDSNQYPDMNHSEWFIAYDSYDSFISNYDLFGQIGELD